MITPSIQKYLNQLLSQRLGLQISSFQLRSIGGGCINDTYQVTINHNIKLFLKINSVTKFPALFEKEKNGLELLDKQKIIHVPSIIAYQEIDNSQILLLEWIEEGIRTEQFWKRFGEQLAALHRQTWSDKNGWTKFGLSEDNYIGSLPQYNNEQKSWIEFFIHYRLNPQIKIGGEKHLLQTKHLTLFENLFTRLPEIFNNEQSALLHGDLWSGNFMCNQNSEPVLIDPAVYFGHRSIDLAMTTLFGGFDKLFYESYHYHFPFPGNYREQWDICNLYPLLIHLNLFGSGYLRQIESSIQKFT
jgi:protein-ribulosamine 3-kinase